MVVFPLLAGLISLVCTGVAGWRYWRRRRPHELAWSIAFALFALAALAEVAGDFFGWSAWLARVYFVSGAILTVGFLGTALLVGTSPREILHSDLRGPIALTCASASWAFGSIYFKRRPAPTSPYVNASIQMITGGLFVTLVGLLAGEAGAFHWSGKAAAAMLYLVIFGSIVGYSAYSYALRHAPATIVGTYAYVNPIIAVLLGALLLHEPVSTRTFAAMALILGAVVWIQFSHLVTAARAAAVPPAAPAGAARQPAQS